LVGNARGAGLIGALELVGNKESKEIFNPSWGVAAHVGERALTPITRALGDTVNFCPPMIIAKADIGEMYARARPCTRRHLYVAAGRSPGGCDLAFQLTPKARCARPYRRDQGSSSRRQRRAGLPLLSDFGPLPSEGSCFGTQPLERVGAIRHQICHDGSPRAAGWLLFGNGC
jgi:hypothetical protein